VLVAVHLLLTVHLHARDVDPGRSAAALAGAFNAVNPALFLRVQQCLGEVTSVAPGGPLLTSAAHGAAAGVEPLLTSAYNVWAMLTHARGVQPAYVAQHHVETFETLCAISEMVVAARAGNSHAVVLKFLSLPIIPQTHGEVDEKASKLNMHTSDEVATVLPRVLCLGLAALNNVLPVSGGDERARVRAVAGAIGRWLTRWRVKPSGDVARRIGQLLEPLSAP